MVALVVVGRSVAMMVEDDGEGILTCHRLQEILYSVGDGIHFLGGYPGNYVALAKKSGEDWYIGVLNNSKGKDVSFKLDFLLEGKYEMEIWSDSKKSNTEPKELAKKNQTVKSGQTIKVRLANDGGYVAIIRPE